MSQEYMADLVALLQDTSVKYMKKHDLNMLPPHFIMNFQMELQADYEGGAHTESVVDFSYVKD
jgi:predicted transcriptional regulator